MTLSHLFRISLESQSWNIVLTRAGSLAVHRNFLTRNFLTVWHPDDILNIFHFDTDMIVKTKTTVLSMSVFQSRLQLGTWTLEIVTKTK